MKHFLNNSIYAALLSRGGVDISTPRTTAAHLKILQTVELFLLKKTAEIDHVLDELEAKSLRLVQVP